MLSTDIKAKTRGAYELAIATLGVPITFTPSVPRKKTTRAASTGPVASLQCLLADGQWPPPGVSFKAGTSDGSDKGNAAWFCIYNMDTNPATDASTGEIGCLEYILGPYDIDGVRGTAVARAGKNIHEPNIYWVERSSGDLRLTAGTRYAITVRATKGMTLRYHEGAPTANDLGMVTGANNRLVLDDQKHPVFGLSYYMSNRIYTIGGQDPHWNAFVNFNERSTTINTGLKAQDFGPMEEAGMIFIPAATHTIGFLTMSVGSIGGTHSQSPASNEWTWGNSPRWGHHNFGAKFTGSVTGNSNTATTRVSSVPHLVIPGTTYTNASQIPKTHGPDSMHIAGRNTALAAPVDIVAGFKTVGVNDDELVNAYGVGAKIITIAAKDVAGTPKKFDKITIANTGEVLTVATVSDVHLNGELVGYRLSTAGK